MAHVGMCNISHAEVYIMYYKLYPFKTVCVCETTILPECCEC